MKKASSMLGVTKNRVENKTANTIMTVYKSMVSPPLEYCVQFWSPQLKNDIVDLEKVLKRVTKMISELGHSLYKEKL